MIFPLTLLANNRGNRKCLEVLQHLTSFELSTTVIDQIKTHPVFGYGSKYKDGRNLIFVVDPYSPSISKTQDKLGERIQADFVVKVLKVIFPKAEFSYSGSTNYLFSGKKAIHIDLKDKGEFENKIGVLPTSFDMALVKAANGLVGTADQGSSRKALGISDKDRVVSFYFNFKNTVSPKLSEKFQFKTFYEEAIKGMGGVDVAIYSEPYVDRDTLISRIDPELRLKLSVYFLSELKEGDIAQARKLGKRVLILNDTVGHMPAIHSSSDIVVIRGPINMFEPLNAGRPVVVVHTKEIQPEYDWQSFTTMAQVAQKSGGATILNDTDGLSGAVRDARQMKVSTPPYLTKTESGVSPIVIFLDALKKHLEFYDLR
jgi:hypothetical protein